MEELNASATNWLSDLEMDESELFSEWHLKNLLDEDDDDNQFLSHEMLMSALVQEEGEGEGDFELHQPLPFSCNYEQTLCLEEEIRPAKQLRTSSSSSSITATHQQNLPSNSSSSSSSPTSQILSFENSYNSSSPPPPLISTHFYGFEFDVTTTTNNNKVSSLQQPPQAGNNKKIEETRKPQSHQGSNNRSKRQGAQSQDHIMAERKRREKLSQSLIALAALIPGLKKMDKATVLGDAIKYVKELQSRLKVLEEEEQNKKREVNSVLVVKKPHPVRSSEDADSSTCDDDSLEAAAVAHVEARVAASEKEVLLRIHCKKQKGIFVKLLSEIQRLHLFVVHSSVLPFGDSLLDITIVAQIFDGSDGQRIQVEH
ncbi:hypothetical protein PIB30_005316 [Stylosanthes scabra]|uniref:BHLH domain-containing protein n=1 Tax=Stylosanthes scabra TaxID=79078 RepID=A0ABU6V2W1_9FABA|nr:hypothetical protein [Stylosanthes scabra]